MSNYNYNLDPFLPFISSYDSTPTPVVEQDPWINATFGFEGDVNFFNNPMLDQFNLPLDSGNPSQYMNNGSMDLSKQKAEAEAKHHQQQTQAQSKKKKEKSVQPLLEEELLDDDENRLDDPVLDKRRRNTLASARFRIRKKQKELELEKNAKELAEKVDDLNQKVKDLEKENKWLRSLLLEKSSR
ncbi:hypothetical protein K502DRAFT_326742 [Neoconidiobolus thromboides FSU 785]|nr:hypothetical protein K502DRAFT_326742 [Neoconidiobolus thromboides FSU 785]